MADLQHHIQNSGMELHQIAVNAGLSIDRLKEIIDHRVDPSMKEIGNLAKALKVPIKFLISETSNSDDISVLFRNSVKSGIDRYRSEKFTYFVTNALSLLDIADYNYNKSIAGLPVVDNSYEGAVTLSKAFRSLYVGGNEYVPLTNLSEILSEKLKYLLYTIDLGVDGASAVVQGIPFIFISPRFAPRMLFTLAHELGHLLYHHRDNHDFAIFDNSISITSRSTQEAFANAFASNLLLPDVAVGTTLRTVRNHFSIKNAALGDIEILYLSRIYGVSFEVAAKRCEDLELLPEGGAASIYQTLISKHKSPEKRADEFGIPAREEIIFPKVPSSLVKAAIKKISTGDISIGKASEVLSIPISAIMEYNSFEETE